MVTSLRDILFRFAKIVGNDSVLHNFVTLFSASVSNAVQKSSVDRSSGGIPADRSDERQSRSLRMFSKRAVW